jgi:cytochrome c oxidase subunit 2
MVLPGQVSKLTIKFDKAGTYNFICTEFCGAGHGVMYGAVIVTP